MATTTGTTTMAISAGTVTMTATTTTPISQKDVIASSDALSPKGNPKDSMKSTWRRDRSQWTFAHHLINVLDPFWVVRGDKDLDPPVFQKTDPLPYLSSWSVHLWILVHAAWPMLLQHLFVRFTGHNLHPLAAFMLYSTAFKMNSWHQVHLLRRLAQTYGFFDGDKHARDDVPDVGVHKALTSLNMTSQVRTVLLVYLTYRRDQGPTLSPWLPLELALYPIILDLFFYTYHRACHEVDFLWRYHRTHHLTKHPIPLLAAYADFEQEFIEIALIPLLTFFSLRALGLPMGFYDWWMCHEYIIWSEAFGHSGLRVYATATGIVTPLLALFGCELVVEDHDLHHRRGWKTSFNYGKATRLWDALFGTRGPRIESEMVDRKNRIAFPLF